MRRAKPGRRVNKRHENEDEIQRDDEIASVVNGLEEYIVISDSSSSVSRSSLSSSASSHDRRSRGLSSSSGSETSRSSHQSIVKAASLAGSGGNRKSQQSEISSDKDKRPWKMDDFFTIYESKQYISGYLYLLHGGEWIKVYGTIYGETMRVVKVPDTIAVQTYEPEPTVEKILSKELYPSLETLESFNHYEPIFIDSITDTFSQVFPQDYTSEIQPLPPIPYTCFFGIDKHIFAASSYISANSWVHAVRLSAYEYGLLNVYFSFTLLRAIPYVRIWSDFEIVPFKTKRVRILEWDGECKIKFGVEKEWIDFYCKVSSAVYNIPSKCRENVGKPSGVLSKFFQRKKSEEVILDSQEEPQEVLVKPAQMALYSSLLDYKKGMAPRFILHDVTFVYALWPKNMNNVKSDVVTEIKVMGNLKNGEYDPSLEPFQVDKNLSSSSNSIFLQSANTHESLHWVVSILGAFLLDADLSACDTNAAVWSNRPSDWGDLSLVLDEVAGLSGSAPLSSSFTEYAKLLSAKKGMLRNGRFSEWKSSVRDSIQTRQNYERKEVELKANELTLWIDKLKNGESQLSSWVESELNGKIGNGNGQNTIKSDSGEETESQSKKKKKNKRFNLVSAGIAHKSRGNMNQNLSNNNSGGLFLHKFSSAKRLAAKAFLTRLSNAVPITFERGTELPSNLWYQEEDARIKALGERMVSSDLQLIYQISDQETSAEVIQIYEANSLLEKETHIVKKTGLENFRIPEKQEPIFAENSLLEKSANFRNSIQIKADGPLLGQIQRDGNRPKLEGGLLGQMDILEKELESFRKSGGYRATMLPTPLDPSQIFPSQGKLAESEDRRQSSRAPTQANQIVLHADAVRNSDQTSNFMMPYMDPRSSLMLAPLGHKVSLMGQPIDPRISYIGQPPDPRFSMKLSEMHYSNVSSLQNDKGNVLADQIKLNSIQSKMISESNSYKSSESGNSDETVSSSGKESGTESTSNESESSQESSEALFAQLEEDEESSGSSSVTSSDDDSESPKSHMEQLNFVPYPYPGIYPHAINGMVAPPFPPLVGGNFQIPHVPSISSQPRSSKSMSSSPASSEKCNPSMRAVESDSGTESDSSLSVDEESSKKKPRSLVIPGKARK